MSSPFLPSSLSSALAMAEAGAGLSETVTETTVTVTTEPVRKAGGGGGDTGREGIGLWAEWGRIPGPGTVASTGALGSGRDAAGGYSGDT